jgi:hypothetical protein
VGFEIGFKSLDDIWLDAVLRIVFGDIFSAVSRLVDIT